MPPLANTISPSIFLNPRRRKISRGATGCIVYHPVPQSDPDSSPTSSNGTPPPRPRNKLVKKRDPKVEQVEFDKGPLDSLTSSCSSSEKTGEMGSHSAPLWNALSSDDVSPLSNATNAGGWKFLHKFRKRNNETDNDHQRLKPEDRGDSQRPKKDMTLSQSVVAESPHHTITKFKSTPDLHVLPRSSSHHDPSPAPYTPNTKPGVPNTLASQQPLTPARIKPFRSTVNLRKRAQSDARLRILGPPGISPIGDKPGRWSDKHSPPLPTKSSPGGSRFRGHPTQPWEPHFVPMTLEFQGPEVSDGLDAFQMTIPLYRHVYVVALDCFDPTDDDDADADAGALFDDELVAALRDTRMSDIPAASAAYWF